ncbi:MAG: murein hydrolase activator EnvC [Lonepinella koalarum]|nr:murein hydrolase activator EnvC [Lonepinella koalarum]
MPTTFIKTGNKLTALLGAFFCILSIESQANNLSQIQQQIKQQEQKIAEQKRKQNQIQSTLKTQENKINSAIGELRQTENNLAETRKLIAETNRQIALLEKQEKEQKVKLAKQLDNIYRSGNPSSVVEHLIADDAQKSDRMKVYYQHLNQARMALISELKATRSQLQEQKNLVSQQQKIQQEQLSGQKKQQQDLQKAKNEREKTLAQLNKNLQQDESRLETLKANENALKQEIERASQVAQKQEQQEKEQLAQRKLEQEKKHNKPYQPTEQEKQLTRSRDGLAGKYAYPVNGKVLHRFGSTQAGEVKWKGIVISAANGSAVKAIADGRVILSSWLQGYGLVVVLDHGKGYMSLYGYNQAVSVKTGTLVKGGQKIAEVGSSGGQGQSGLYFEIRRQGQAINPQSWLK